MKKEIGKIKIDKFLYDTYCNKCGDKIIPQTSFMDEFSITGGYHNKYLEDNITYTFSLCEKCLKELFNTFKIPVDKKDLEYIFEYQ